MPAFDITQMFLHRSADDVVCCSCAQHGLRSHSFLCPLTHTVTRSLTRSPTLLLMLSTLPFHLHCQSITNSLIHYCACAQGPGLSHLRWLSALPSLCLATLSQLPAQTSIRPKLPRYLERCHLTLLQYPISWHPFFHRSATALCCCQYRLLLEA